MEILLQDHSYILSICTNEMQRCMQRCGRKSLDDKAFIGSIDAQGFMLIYQLVESESCILLSLRFQSPFKVFDILKLEVQTADK